MGKNRTMSICLSDLPKERIVKHENGKMYLNISTYDYDEADKYGNNFSVSLPLTKEEQKEKKDGKDVKRVFLGSGKIWEDTNNFTPLTEGEKDDLPF